MAKNPHLSPITPDSHYLNINVGLHGMFPGKKTVNRIKCLCMKISFPAFGTDFGTDIFDYVQFFVEPVLTSDTFFSRVPATEFTQHRFTYEAYAVMIIRFAPSLIRSVRIWISSFCLKFVISGFFSVSYPSSSSLFLASSIGIVGSCALLSRKAMNSSLYLRLSTSASKSSTIARTNS